ncbi:hypothetical protein DB31_2911 [Hyalangium minutum]|uniref:Uncharacterized protein n=1 Tax=Hyalangium minutum TaxID=394096 RepID=A0A085W6K5_9BACT|nr:hypothetical protein DB31_2911 [Hyalangium minutum]
MALRPLVHGDEQRADPARRRGRRGQGHSGEQHSEYQGFHGETSTPAGRGPEGCHSIR